MHTLAVQLLGDIIVTLLSISITISLVNYTTRECVHSVYILHASCIAGFVIIIV